MMVDKTRFSELLTRSPESLHINGGVGTLSEKYLHALLKHCYEPDTDFHEVGIGSFTADVCRDNKIVEIQTRSLNRLREKLEFYLENGYDVTVVYPVPHFKYIMWIDPRNGELSKRRRSPKVGTFYDAAYELYKIKYFLDWDNLHIDLLLVDVEDYRNLNGYGKDKKYRSTRLERVPLQLYDVMSIRAVQDYKLFVPDGLPALFTIRDFAEYAHIKYECASALLNILCYLQITSNCGKQGRMNLYKLD